VFKTREFIYLGVNGMDDNALLRAARSFDSEALRTIFDLYASDLYNYALRFCQNPVEADEVVGDVFAQLLEYLAKSKGPKTNLRAYLYQITYHVIVDQARHNRHFAPLDVAEESGSDGVTVVSQVEEKELMDVVMKAINSELTLDQRYVIVLRFVEGFSLNETATILGKSINNIKVIENRGMQKLRHALGKFIEDGK
jgi:RNA polymerase sigma-70 factor, ECF subfamily